MKYLGDIPSQQTIDFMFTTVQSTGAPSTLSGTPAISVYKSNSTTQTTTGVTLTVDFDGVTGLNHVRIATSDAFYTAGDFHVVITTGTVNSVSVVGYVVALFSIENRSALRPTTSGRTLDVSSGGEAGVDWANVGSPTTTLNLSGTTVKTATDVETDTQDIQSRLPAALVSGRMSSDAVAISGSTTAADNVEANIANLDAAVTSRLAPTTAGRTLDVAATGEAGLDFDNIKQASGSTTLTNITVPTVTSVGTVTGNVDGNVGGNVTGSVGSLATQAKADVNAEVDTALADINLDHLVKSAVDTDFATTVHLSSVVGHLADNGTTATFDRTTDSLEAIRDRGDSAWVTASPPSAATIADAVWDEARSGHATSGTFGEGVASVQGNVTGNVGGNVTGSVGSVASGGISSSSFASGAINAAAIAADAIGASELASDAIAEIADAVWDEARSGHATSGTFGEGVSSVQGNVTGNVAGSVGSVSGAVGSVTGNVGGNVTGSVGSLATQAKADVNAEVDTALSDINLDHLVKIAVDTDFATTVHLNSVVGQLADNGTSATFDRTTDSLEAIRDRGDAAWTTGGGGGGSSPTAAEIADAVWDEARSGHTSAGSFGEGVPVSSGGISSSSFAAGAINAAAIAADAIGASELAADAVAEIADAVWDEAQSGHTSAGTFGKNLDAQVSTVSTGGLSAADIADAVWDETQSGHTTAGTFGKYLDAQVSSVESTAAGPGGDSVTIRIMANGSVIANASVWITSDAAGNTVVAGPLQTNSSGQATFLLDDGETYYLWMRKDGVNPIRGQQFTAEAD